MKNQGHDLLTASEATALLGVKLDTLYAYVSRGWISSVPAGGKSRARLYPRGDLERLRARRDARAGHGPVAAGALRWGQPVLESKITSISADLGPMYRGRAAVDLARRGVPYEEVAEILWSDPPQPGSWRIRGLGYRAAAVHRLIPRDASFFSALSLAAAAAGAQDPDRFDLPTAVELGRARALIGRLGASLALLRGHEAVAAALKEESVSAVVARALGARRAEEVHRALNSALVVAADHELNASSFAARIAASAGADLYAVVGAALATVSGPRHGGACDRIESLVHETGGPSRAAAVIRDRTRRGEEVPGFGHPLYPAGDPRTEPLLEAARALAPRKPAVKIVFALIDAMRSAGREPPTIDCGLVAISAALDLWPGSAAALFAAGRSAGWIAHALEQREQGALLRPRARYVGNPPMSRAD